MLLQRMVVNMPASYKYQYEAEELKARLAQISDVDIAWFAGWLSADGCIAYHGKENTPQIQFKICDRDPLERFAELFGGYVGGPHSVKKHYKPTYTWQFTGLKAAYILARCMPWLSLRYQKRAALALQYKLAPRAAPSADNLSAYMLGFLTNLHSDELVNSK